MLAVPGSPPVPVSAAGGQGQGQSDDWERAAPAARPAAASSNAAIRMVLMVECPMVEPGARARRQRLDASAKDSRLLDPDRRPAAEDPRRPPDADRRARHSCDPKQTEPRRQSQEGSGAAVVSGGWGI